MRLQSKYEINSNLGRYGFFNSADKILLKKIQYLGGLPELDKILANTNRDEYLTNLEVRPKGLEIRTVYFFTNRRVGLSFEQIDFIVIESQKQIIEKESKSIIGAALVAGILFGPVGAIVGGMSGIENKESNLFPVDNILSIKVKDPDELLAFSVQDKDFKTVEDYLIKFFKLQYRRFDQLEQPANSAPIKFPQRQTT